MNLVNVVNEIHDEHDNDGVDILASIVEITFGFEHMVAEFFWNAVFLIVGYAVSKAIALRKIHKYIDDKHGVSHDKKEY